MEPNIAENIRTLRKEKKLTQEQLAEAMGVSTGAVHKWETGLSTPELVMVMELADFFDVSVDVLVGYRIRDNREEATIKRLAGFCKTRDTRALTETEKALQKYPNSFGIVYAGASVYHVFGIDGKYEKELRRSLELYEKALTLLPQNKDTHIGEQDIYGGIAGVYELLGDFDRSMEIMKQHNQYGLFDDELGLGMALFLKRYNEAEPYLSNALVKNYMEITNVVCGLVVVLEKKNDLRSALDILKWEQSTVKILRKGKEHGHFEKTEALTLVLEAHIRLKMKKRKEAVECMKKAYRIATRFDSAPLDFGSDFRFISVSNETSFHDGLGVTAGESIEKLLSILDSDELVGIWRNEREYGN